MRKTALVARRQIDDRRTSWSSPHQREVHVRQEVPRGHRRAHCAHDGNPLAVLDDEVASKAPSYIIIAFAAFLSLVVAVGGYCLVFPTPKTAHEMMK